MILYFSWLSLYTLADAPSWAKPEEKSVLPDSIKRVGNPFAFPNEYPGQIYAFNWCLNGDGVTPLRRSAFRITKPLDLKVAGLSQPSKNPLKVCTKYYLSCFDFIINLT